MSEITKQMNDLSVNDAANTNNNQNQNQNQNQTGRRQYVPPHLRNRPQQQQSDASDIPFGGSRRTGGYNNNGGYNNGGYNNGGYNNGGYNNYNRGGYQNNRGGNYGGRGGRGGYNNAGGRYQRPTPGVGRWVEGKHEPAARNEN